MAESKAEFMRRWIAMGSNLWGRCEGYGINWRAHRMEELEFLCSLVESDQPNPMEAKK